jgi:hypothetical protein
MHRVNITDGEKTSVRAGVDAQHRLKVTNTASRNYPDVNPPNTPNYYRYLTGLLGTTGLNSGTTDMNVDGSVTPVEFYMTSDAEYDIYVTDIIVSVIDGVVSHAKWGNVAYLTNGFDLEIRESGAITKIYDGVKSVGECLEAFSIMSPFGSGTDLNIITNYSGVDDAFLGVLQMDEVLPFGLRIGRGSTDILRARVNDDLTGLTGQYVRILGYRHYPIGTL